MNRLLDGTDECLLALLLESLDRPYRIITSAPGACPDQLQEHLLHGREEGSESLSLLDRIPRILKAIEEVPANMNLAVIVDFPVWRLGELRRNRSLRKLFGHLREMQRPLVPVRLVSTDPVFPGGRLYNRLTSLPRRVELRIGSAMSVEEQMQLSGDGPFHRFVQSRIFALGSSLEVRRFFNLSLPGRPGKEEPVAPPGDTEKIAADIQKLTYRNLLSSQGPFDVLTATATELPNALPEIGRLRELTFRAVGEGTGKARDLDEYDLYYFQLIIWDREERRIIGGYRMGPGDRIFAQMGVEGFYIHSLFKIEEGFYPILVKSVELGRSYVVPDYQRKRLPLFLLWKGILYFLLQNPQYQYLYGPVSVSKHYSNISKSLIVSFIRKYYFDHELAQFLRPRKPFKAKVEKVDVDLLMEQLDPELRSLDNIIEEIEPAHFRMPVLMRQYIKLNARFISFNVDPNFSDVLDGFIILDLNELPLEMIEALKKEGSSPAE